MTDVLEIYNQDILGYLGVMEIHSRDIQMYLAKSSTQ